MRIVVIEISKEEAAILHLLKRKQQLIYEYIGMMFCLDSPKEKLVWYKNDLTPTLNLVSKTEIE